MRRPEPESARRLGRDELEVQLVWDEPPVTENWTGVIGSPATMVTVVGEIVCAVETDGKDAAKAARPKMKRLWREWREDAFKKAGRNFVRIKLKFEEEFVFIDRTRRKLKSFLRFFSGGRRMVPKKKSLISGLDFDENCVLD